MATYLVDGATPLPENGDTGWGSTLNTAIQAIDGRFTYSSPSYSLASTVLGSSLTSVGTLTSLSVSGAGSIGGNLTVTGNLTVNGTTTTTNSTIVTVDDPIFTLGGDTAPGSDDDKDRGIEFRWHNGAAAKIGFFGFDDSTGKFTFIPDATNSSEVFSGSIGEIDAQVSWSNILSKPDPEITVTLTDDVTGTSSVTLTDLASGTVTISTSIAASSITSDLIGDVYASNGSSKVLESGTDGTDATFTGNASTASALATARTIELTGDVAGSVSFDGSANVSMSTTVQTSAVELGADTTGDYVESLTAGTGVILSGTIGEGSIPIVGIGQAVGTTDDVTFNSVSASLSGNVTGDLTGSITGDVYASDGTSKVLDNGTNGTDATFTGSVTGTVSDISNHDVEDLANVNYPFGSPSTGDHLYFDGSNWINRPIDLDTLSDVSIGFFPPSSGDFLVYDGSNWGPSTVSPVHTKAYYDSAITNDNSSGTAAWADITVLAESSDDTSSANLWNATSDTFTAASAGTYRVDVQYRTGDTASYGNSEVRVMKNASTHGTVLTGYTNGDIVGETWFVSASASDTISFEYRGQINNIRAAIQRVR